jgi:hypothetical protein
LFTLSLPAKAALAKPSSEASDNKESFSVVVKLPFNISAAKPDLSSDSKYSEPFCTIFPKIP